MATRIRKSGSALYRAAKIDERMFQRVVEAFARDSSVTDAAKRLGLSINSVHALFRKLRVFFFEVGLFRDYYDGADPETFVAEDPVLEHKILSFHLARVAAKRGLKSPTTEPPYHFAESCWRYDYHVMRDKGRGDSIERLMTAHLLEIIRLCGPIGAPPRNRLAGIRAAARHLDQRALWLKRNAPGFSDASLRASLQDIYDLPLGDA